MKRNKYIPVVQIVRKELRRVFLDRKLVFALFILPLLITIGLYSLIGILVTNQMDETNQQEEVIYLYNLPQELKELVNQMEHVKVTLIEEEQLEQSKSDIKNGDVDLLVAFEKDFTSLIDNYSEGAVIPEVKTYYNPSETTSNNAREAFLNQVLNPYKTQVLNSRLDDMNKLVVFDIDREEESSQLVDTKRATGKLLGTIIPYMVVIFLFAGAMSLCIDSITGEKERGTLTSLLISPISRAQLVSGKLLSLSILSCLSAITYAVSMLIALPYTLATMGFEGSIGLSLVIGITQIIELLLLVVALVFLYVAMISLVAVFAKSTKVASGYISPLYMIIMVAGMITMFEGEKAPALGEYAIPVYGTAKAIQSLLSSELTMGAFLVNMGVTLGMSLLLTKLIIKAFKSEKLMLNA